MRIPIRGLVRPSSRPEQAVNPGNIDLGFDAITSGVNAVGASLVALEQKQNQNDSLIINQIETDARSQITQETQELERNTVPGDPKYLERITEINDRINKETLAKVAEVNPGLIGRSEVRVNQFRVQQKDRAINFNNKQLDAAHSAAIDRQVATAATTLQANPDRETFDREITELTKTIGEINLSDADKVAKLTQARRELGVLLLRGLHVAQKRIGEVTPGSVIKDLNVFQPSVQLDPKDLPDDPDTLKAGFGSNKVLRDGKLIPITSGMRITREEAEATLQFRLDKEVRPALIGQVGDAAWAQLPRGAQEALLSLTWDLGSLPADVVKAVKANDPLLVSQAVGAIKLNGPKRQQEAQIIARSMQGPGPIRVDDVEVTVDANGFARTPGLVYDNELRGKKRPLPVSAQYVKTVMGAINAMKIGGLGVKIVSGAQLPRHQHGSSRHNIDPETGTGNTSDLVLQINGKDVRPRDNPELYARVVARMAAAGFTGIGHYPWGIHVGSGAPAVWGPDGKSRSANPIFREAYNQGRARNVQGFTADDRFADLTARQKIAAEHSATAQVRSEKAQEAATIKAEQANILNQALIDIERKALDRNQMQQLIDSGVLPSYTQHEKLRTAMKAAEEEGSNRQFVQDAIRAGNPVPNTNEGRKGLDAEAKARGLVPKLASLDPGAQRELVQLSSDAKLIPPSALEQLVALTRSADPGRALYALDTLRQIGVEAPNAIKQQLDANELRQLASFDAYRNIAKSPEEIHEMVFGPRDPDARERALALDKVAATNITDEKTKNDFSDERMIDLVTDRNLFLFGEREPELPFPSHLLVGIKRRHQAVYRAEFRKSGDHGAALKVADASTLVDYGVSQAGGQAAVFTDRLFNKRGVVMLYPPEQLGYPKTEKGLSYIDKQVRTELKMKDDKEFFLIGDDTTIAQHKARLSAARAGVDVNKLPMPSYLVSFKDDNGQWMIASGEQGGHKRMSFAIPANVAAENEKVLYKESKRRLIADFSEQFLGFMKLAKETGEAMPQALAAEAKEMFSLFPTLEKRLESRGNRLTSVGGKRLTSVEGPTPRPPARDKDGNILKRQPRRRRKTRITQPPGFKN